MDVRNSQDYKYRYYTKYNANGSLRYKYEEEGILKRCLPRILFKGNTIFTTFLQFIDMRIVMTLKYVEHLKKFKYISRY